jgi:hypothetical protein
MTSKTCLPFDVPLTRTTPLTCFSLDGGVLLPYHMHAIEKLGCQMNREDNAEAK